jgi:thiamine-monophosphate kinase
MTEFQLIEHYFAKRRQSRQDVLLGIGDDAALLQIPANQILAASSDTLIAGIHFPENTKPQDIAYKSLAVNLSDLAAMGAQPAWIMLALTLPEIKEDWLDLFYQGFFELMDEYHLALVGGDTTKGELSITLQAMGFVPENQALKRSAAKPGDGIYVTGTLGDAGLALRILQNQITLNNISEKNFLFSRLNRPSPRINIGIALRNISHCAIDISDGLGADLNHILEASGVGARVCVDDLPVSSALTATVAKEEAIDLALNAGDDYELCFTVSPSQEKHLSSIIEKEGCAITRIGVIEKGRGLNLHYRDGNPYQGRVQGYQHFLGT